jgi:hypothetical protein
MPILIERTIARTSPMPMPAGGKTDMGAYEAAANPGSLLLLR